MSGRCPAFLLMLGLCCTAPTFAQDSVSQQGTGNSRGLLLDLATTMEEMYGAVPYASRSIREYSDAEVDFAFGFLKDRDGFLEKTRLLLDGLQAARAKAATGEQALPQSPGRSTRDIGVVRRTTTPPPAAPPIDDGSDSRSAGYDPAYPPDSGWYLYNVLGPLRLMGAVSDVSDRCGDFDNLPLPQGTGELAFDLEMAVGLGNAYCAAAQCDPTGLIVCAETCTPVAILNLALWVVKLPVEMCKYHDGNVDAAELEAAFENSVTIVGDLETIDGAVGTLWSKLSDHDAEVREVLATVKADLAFIKTDLAALQSRLTQQQTMLDTVLANQRAIQELLSTPQGQRPQWNDR